MNSTRMTSLVPGIGFWQLPDRFDIHEWSIMEEFARGQDNDRIRQELLDAIHGAGAFRMFRSLIRPRH
jgi:hypothetical protein